MGGTECKGRGGKVERRGRGGGGGDGRDREQREGRGLL